MIHGNVRTSNKQATIDGNRNDIKQKHQSYEHYRILQPPLCVPAMLRGSDQNQNIRQKCCRLVNMKNYSRQGELWNMLVATHVGVQLQIWHDLDNDIGCCASNKPIRVPIGGLDVLIRVDGRTDRQTDRQTDILKAGGLNFA